MKKKLEICCDASITTYPNGRTFGCAGAVAIGLNIERTMIVPDSTNNIAELMAMYTAVKLADEMQAVDDYDTTIYADSKFVVFGLKVWMDSWLRKMDRNGIMYNSNNEPVKNQDLFAMIISYMVTNNLRLKIRHQKGHVKVLSEGSMEVAQRVFYRSTGYRLDHDTLSRISYYNNKIDYDTKQILKTTNPDNYPIMPKTDGLENVCKYVIPCNYKDYIL